ncbi:MAG: NUDIX domain-containing protein [Nanoarchaeota archaeon]
MSFDKILNEVIKEIGLERNGDLEKPLYDFVRRYGPMICVDVVLIPEGKEPRVILAKRGRQAVAPGEWWIFGGRVDKKVNYLDCAKAKVQKECGLEVEIKFEDIIGIGSTYFKKGNVGEEKLRDYDVATANLCFGKVIELNDKMKEKLNPRDGYDDEWEVFDRIDPSWHPYIINAVFNIWVKIFGKDKVLKDLDKRVRKILEQDKSFISLSYNSPLL